MMEDAYHLRHVIYPEVMVSLYRPIPYARIEVGGVLRQHVAYYDPNIPAHLDRMEAPSDTDDYIKDKYGVLNRITVETRQSVGFGVIRRIAVAIFN